MDKVRIAKQLIKIAKGLVASDDFRQACQDITTKLKGIYGSNNVSIKHYKSISGDDLVSIEISFDIDMVYGGALNELYQNGIIKLNEDQKGLHSFAIKHVEDGYYITDNHNGVNYEFNNELISENDLQDEFVRFADEVITDLQSEPEVITGDIKITDDASKKRFVDVYMSDFGIWKQALVEDVYSYTFISDNNSVLIQFKDPRYELSIDDYRSNVYDEYFEKIQEIICDIEDKDNEYTYDIEDDDDDMYRDPKPLI